MQSAMKERDTVWVRDVDGEVRVGFSNVFFTALLSWEEHGAPVPSMLPAVVSWAGKAPHQMRKLAVCFGGGCKSGTGCPPSRRQGAVFPWW